MESLFIEKTEPKFEKIAGLYLDSDQTTWVKAIITEFCSQFPMLQEYPMQVNWKSVDYKKGYGVGMLSVVGGQIILVVKNFELSPFDVINIQGVFVPFTLETLQELISNGNAFKAAINVTDKTSLAIFGTNTNSFSPINALNSIREGSTVQSATEKFGSFTPNFTDKETKIKFLTAVKDAFGSITSDDSNGTAEVIQKYANLEIISKEDLLQDMLKDSLKIDRRYVYETELGDYIVKEADARFDYTHSFKVDFNKTPEYLKNAINQGDLTNAWKYKMVDSNDFTKTAECADAKTSKKEIKVGETGHFKDKGGKVSEKVVIEKIEKKKPFSKVAFLPILNEKTALFIDVDGNNAIIDENISQDLIKESSYIQVTGSVPQKGDYGVFLLNNVATRPFTIEKTAKHQNNYEVLGTNLVESVNYRLLPITSSTFTEEPNVKIAAFSEVSTKVINVPKNASFVKLSSKSVNYSLSALKNLLNSSANEEDYFITVNNGIKTATLRVIPDDTSDFEHNLLSKTAEFVDIATTINNFVEPDNYIYKQANGSYNLVANNDISTFDNINDINWELIRRGASKEDITKVAELAAREKHKLSSKLNKLEKIASLENAVDAIVSDTQKTHKIFEFKPELVKVAAQLNNKNSVDAVLSLNLIKRYNITEFINLIPEYEKVASELAQLLVSIRLGVVPIDERAIKIAMESIISTVFILKQVQNATSKPKSVK